MAAVSPVSLLPAELLVQTFICLRNVQKEHNKLPPYEHEDAFSQVCSRWRAIALDYAVLWTDISTRTVKSTTLSIQRSKLSPVTVYVDYQSDEAAIELCHQSLGLRDASLSRLRALKLHLPSYRLPPRAYLFGPALTHLHLMIQYFMSDAMSDILRPLSRIPQLESLVLDVHEQGPFFIIESDEFIELPRLQEATFNAYCAYPMGLLQHISAPLERGLHIDMRLNPRLAHNSRLIAPMKRLFEGRRTIPGLYRNAHITIDPSSLSFDLDLISDVIPVRNQSYDGDRRGTPRFPHDFRLKVTGASRDIHEDILTTLCKVLPLERVYGLTISTDRMAANAILYTARFLAHLAPRATRLCLQGSGATRLVAEQYIPKLSAIAPEYFPFARNLSIEDVDAFTDLDGTALPLLHVLSAYAEQTFGLRDDRRLTFRRCRLSEAMESELRARLGADRVTFEHSIRLAMK